MKTLVGNSYRQELDNNTYLDVSVYPSKWTTVIDMSFWERGNLEAIKHESKRYFNFERILPKSIVTHIARYFINKQSRRVAQYDLV